MDLGLARRRRAPCGRGSGGPIRRRLTREALPGRAARSSPWASSRLEPRQLAAGGRRARPTAGWESIALATAAALLLALAFPDRPRGRMRSGCRSCSRPSSRDAAARPVSARGGGRPLGARQCRRPRVAASGHRGAARPRGARRDRRGRRHGGRRVVLSSTRRRACSSRRRTRRPPAWPPPQPQPRRSSRRRRDPAAAWPAARSGSRPARLRRRGVLPVDARRGDPRRRAAVADAGVAALRARSLPAGARARLDRLGAGRLGPGRASLRGDRRSLRAGGIALLFAPSASSSSTTWHS